MEEREIMEMDVLFVGGGVAPSAEPCILET